MPQTTVEIPTPDGTAQGSLHTPDGDGPWPGVVLFPDAGGLRDTFRTQGARLANLGYVVLVPDVYYREAGWQPFDMGTVFGDEAEMGRLFGLMQTLTKDRIIADSGAYIDFLLARSEVSGSAVGTTGYCMGGRMSLITAGAHGDKVGAAASFHGGMIAMEEDPDSPHRDAPNITAKVYVAGAQDDQYYTEDHAKLLETALTDAGVDYTHEFYPALHGFAVPDNPTHDAAAEDRHWKAIEELYGSALPR